MELIPGVYSLSFVSMTLNTCCRVVLKGFPKTSRAKVQRHFHTLTFEILWFSSKDKYYITVVNLTQFWDESIAAPAKSVFCTSFKCKRIESNQSRSAVQFIVACLTVMNFKLNVISAILQGTDMFSIETLKTWSKLRIGIVLARKGYFFRFNNDARNAEQKIMQRFYFFDTSG